MSQSRTCQNCIIADKASDMYSTAVAPWLLLVAVFGTTACTPVPAPQQCGQREVQEVLTLLRSGVDVIKTNVSERPRLPQFASPKGYKLVGDRLFPLSLVARNVTIQRSLCSEEEHHFDFTIPVGGEDGDMTGFWEYLFEGEDGTEPRRSGRISVTITGSAINGKLIHKQSAANTERQQLIFGNISSIVSSAEVSNPEGFNVPYHHMMDDALRLTFDFFLKIAENEVFPLLSNALGIRIQ